MPTAADKGAAPESRSPRPEGSPAMLAKLRKRKRAHDGPPTHEVAGCDPAFVGVYDGAWELCWIESRHEEEGTMDVTVIDSETAAKIFCERVPNRWLRVREVKAEQPPPPAPAPAKAATAKGRPAKKSKARSKPRAKQPPLVASFASRPRALSVAPIVTTPVPPPLPHSPPRRRGRTPSRSPAPTSGLHVRGTDEAWGCVECGYTMNGPLAASCALCDGLNPEFVQWQRWQESQHGAGSNPHGDAASAGAPIGAQGTPALLDEDRVALNDLERTHHHLTTTARSALSRVNTNGAPPLTPSQLQWFAELQSSIARCELQWQHIHADAVRRAAAKEQAAPRRAAAAAPVVTYQDDAGGAAPPASAAAARPRARSRSDSCGSSGGGKPGARYLEEFGFRKMPVLVPARCWDPRGQPWNMSAIQLQMSASGAAVKSPSVRDTGADSCGGTAGASAAASAAAPAATAGATMTTFVATAIRGRGALHLKIGMPPSEALRDHLLALVARRASSATSGADASAAASSAATDALADAPASAADSAAVPAAAATAADISPTAVRSAIAELLRDCAQYTSTSLDEEGISPKSGAGARPRSESDSSTPQRRTRSPSASMRKRKQGLAPVHGPGSTGSTDAVLGSSLAFPRAGVVVPANEWSDMIAYEWPMLELSLAVQVRPPAPPVRPLLKPPR